MIETTAHTETGAETVRLRRSVLFMPGSNERALIKARSLSADAIIMDLEDAVAPDSKAAARDQITKALREGGYGSRECIVRVNALDTPWGEDDLRAVAHMNVHAVLLTTSFVVASDSRMPARALNCRSGPCSKHRPRSSMRGKSAPPVHI
jgi:citrate lyase beta subunit